MHFEEGAIIMDYGVYVRSVPLVLKGSIKVLKESENTDKELLLYYLNSGDTCSVSFSWMARSLTPANAAAALNASTYIAISMTNLLRAAWT